MGRFVWLHSSVNIAESKDDLVESESDPDAKERGDGGDETGSLDSADVGPVSAR